MPLAGLGGKWIAIKLIVNDNVIFDTIFFFNSQLE